MKLVRFLPNDLYPINLSVEEEISLIEESIELKLTILSMITKANSGHPGGSLSSTDILVCLYNKVMNHFPENPENPKRDIFILSKGHAAPALYAILAKYGYFNSKLLDTLRQFGSPLQGHPKKGNISGIEISTGSLGTGPPVGVGMALAARLDGISKKIYVLLGDGECNEGPVWEAAMSASHFSLDNLIFIIDRNAIQLDGPTEEIMSVEPFAAKWEAFGWNVIEVDGTSFRELLMAFETAKTLRGKPTVIIAYMIKGQGVSFMQHVREFHGKPPTQEQYYKAIKELQLVKNKMIKKIRENGEI